MVARIEMFESAVRSKRSSTATALQGLLPAGGARKALDCALWELEARQTGTPVWRLAGAPKPTRASRPSPCPPTSPPCSPSESRTAFVAAIKLKLDGDIDADSERLRIVRHHYPDSWLMADANQGFRSDEFDMLELVLVENRVAHSRAAGRRGEEASSKAGGRRSRSPPTRASSTLPN